MVISSLATRSRSMFDDPSSTRYALRNVVYAYIADGN